MDMRLKRALCLVLALILLLALAACGGKEKEEEEDLGAAYDKGLEVIALMAEVARNEDYLEAMNTPAECFDLALSLGGGRYSSPKHVYAITAPSLEDALEDYLMANGGDDDATELRRALRGLSDELLEYMNASMFSAISTSVDAMMVGSSALAAKNICSAGTVYVDRSVEEPFAYLYTFKSGYPALVSFVPGEDGTVAVSGTFSFYEELNMYSAREIRKLIDGLMGFEVEVERVD